MAPSNEKRLTRFLLICGPIACVAFISAVYIQGALRDDYSSLVFPLSSLALGQPGWIQTLNFMSAGVLIMLYAWGVYRALRHVPHSKLVSAMIALSGLGLLGAGIFTTDPIYGYPPGEPMHLSQFTVTGRLHDFVSLFVFIGLPIGIFRLRKCCEQQGWNRMALYSLCSAIGMLVFFILCGAGFKQVGGLVIIAGFLQRFTMIIGCTWFTVLAFFLLRRKYEMPDPGHIA